MNQTPMNTAAFEQGSCSGLNREVYSLALKLIFSGRVVKVTGQLRGKNSGGSQCYCVTGLLIECYRRLTRKGRWVPLKKGFGTGFSYQDKRKGRKFGYVISEEIEQFIGLNNEITSRMQELNDNTDLSLARLLELADEAQRLRNEEKRGNKPPNPTNLEEKK